MSRKEKFLFKSFLERAEKQLFFRNILLDSTMITFSLYFPISLPKLFLIPPQGGSSLLYITAWKGC